VVGFCSFQLLSVVCELIIVENQSYAILQSETDGIASVNAFLP